MKAVWINLAAAAAVVAVCLLCFRLDALLPFTLPDTPDCMAWIFLLAGAGMIVAAVAALLSRGGSTGAPADPTRRLVRSGIYRWLRNPIYAGGALVLLGVSLARSSPVLLLAACLFPIVLHFTVVRSEEERMERDFGQAYLAYKKTVPRWIPRPRKPSS